MAGAVVKTLRVCDEPTDVAFASGKAFVSISTLDAIEVFDLGDLDAAPGIVSLFAAVTLLSFAMNVISGLRYTRVSAEILFDMRLDLYRHLQRLSPR